MDEAQYREITTAGLKLLSRREHSQLELMQKLSAKNYPVEIVLDVIMELGEQGWQSDQRFTESYARHRIKQGYGPVKILYELRQKGIADADLTEIVLDVAGSWQDLLAQVFHKKYPGDQILTPKEWVKCCRFLQQRGFPAEMIRGLSRKLTMTAG